MKKGTKIFLISLIVILMLAIIAAFTYCTINKYAYAEYADITNDTILNFNQLVSLPVSNIASNVSSSYYTTIASFQYVANHKVFIKSNFDSNESGNLLALGNGTGAYEYIKGEYIFEYSGNLNFNSIIYKSGLPAGTYYINFIDLTQMFNSNDIPSLEECKKLFNAPYYNYNKGTPMFFGLNENDMMQHIEYRLNTGIVSGYSQNVTNTQVSFNNQGQLFLSGTASENYAGYFLINLKTTIPIGSIVTLNFNSYLKPSGSSISLCYANLEEKFIIDIPASSNDNSPFTYSFVTWEETSAFYLICNNYSSGTIMTINDATISVQASSDYTFNLQAQYDLGYNDATAYYTQGYGRQEIWQKGFNEGKAKGLQEANGTFTAMDYVKSAFVTLGDIMNIEVFPNFTLGAFFLLPLITGAIFFIIKISKGG